MAQYQQLAIEKFTEGMIDEDQLSRIAYPEGSSTDCENVMFMPTGALKKRPGYEKLNSSEWASGNPVIKVGTFITTGSPGTNYALSFSSCATTAASACIASVQTTGVGSSVASFTTIQGTGSQGSAWAPEYTDVITLDTYAGSAVFTHWSNALIPMVWPATDASANCIEVAACPSGAKVLAAWGNYLFLGNVLVGSVRHGSRIQWNTSSTIDSWPAAQYIELDADDGDEITCMFIYRNKLVVFKKYKMFVIHYVGGQLMFQEERISAGIGCVGPNAYQESGGVVYFIGAYTAYKWEGSGEPIAISDKIQGQFDDMDMDICQTYDVDSDDANWQVWFSIASAGSTVKDKVLVYDSRFKSWTRFEFYHTPYYIGSLDYGVTEAYQNRPLAYVNYNERIQDARSNKEGVLVIGGLGYLYEYGSVDNDDGNAIDGYWCSRWLDFGLPHSNKRLIRGTAFIECLGEYYLHLDIYKDWNNVTPTTQQTVSLSGSIDTPMAEKRADFTLPFRSMQVKLYTDGTSEPFTLHRLLIDWVPKGKTLVA